MHKPDSATTNSEELSVAAPADTVAEARKPNSWPVKAVLVLFVLLLGAAGYVWTLLVSAKERLQQVELQSAKSARTLLEQLALDKGHLLSQIQPLEKHQAELREAIIELRKLAGRERQGWILAEAEYLLLIANQRVRLAADPVTAIEALRQADGRLQQLADPQLLDARKHIVAEISSLRALKMPDIPGMIVTLDKLIADAEHLPALVVRASKMPEAKPAPGKEQTSDWRATLQGVWSEAKTLIEIRHYDDKPVLLNLTAEQEKALHQVLGLRLQVARSALFAQGAPQFTSAINLTEQWVQKHFDTEDQRVVVFKRSLAELNGVNIAPKLPDISASLHEVRFHLNKKSGTAPTNKTADNDTRDKPAPVTEKETKPKAVEKDVHTPTVDGKTEL